MLERRSPDCAPPSAAGSSELALAEVVDEIAAQLQTGERIDIERYVVLYPAWAEPLRRLLPTLEGLAVAGRGAGAREDEPERIESRQPALTPAVSQREREEHDSIQNPKSKIQNRLGDFELVREVGRGGMGVVYEARQVSLGRRVAVKVLPQAGMLDPRQLQRFQNEARAAAHLSHPHIVDAICVGCDDGVHYFAMRFVEGQTLAEVIDQCKMQNTQKCAAGSQGKTQNGACGNTPDCDVPNRRTQDLGPKASQKHPKSKIRNRKCAEWIAQAADALEHAHSLGIVHRDVKPSNLLVDGEDKLWVTDFGLARFGDDARLTMTGDVLGTLRYMSPEQALGQRGAIDHRSDIYALGATFYELLAGVPAFGGIDRSDLLRQLVFSQPRPLRKIVPYLPRELETITLKALEKTPADRYASAGEMATDLRRFLRGEPIHAKPPTLSQRSFKWCLRHRRIVSAAAAVLLFAALGLSVSTLLISRSRDQAVAAGKLLEDRNRENRRMLSAIETRLALQAYQRGELERANELLERQLPASKIRENPGGDNLPASHDQDFRDFTWHWLHAAIRARLPLSRSFDGYPSEISEIAYSPDGTLLAAACNRGIVIREVQSGAIRYGIPAHDSIVTTLEFSSDGALLASVGNDHRVRLWDMKTGKLATDLGAHDCEATAVGFSPDGSRLATGDNGGLIRIWDVPGRREEKTLKGHTGKIDGTVFVDSGTLIAISDIDHLMISWDIDAGQPRWKLQAPHTELLTLVVSKDRTTIAASDRAGTVGLWNVADGRDLGVVGAKPNPVPGVALSPDGRLVAAGGDDGITQLWDLVSQSFRGQTAEHHGRVRSAAFSRDGRTLATAGRDCSVKFWEVNALPYHHKVSFEKGWVQFAFSSNGDLAAVDEKQLWLWPRESFVPKACAKLPDQPWPAHASLAWLNEELLWTPCTGDIAVLGLDGASHIRAKRSQRYGGFMQVSRDGQWLVTYNLRLPTYRESTELWRLGDKTLHYQYEGTPMVLMSDSKHALLVRDKRLQRLRLDDLAIEDLGTASEERPSVAISRDDRLVAFGKFDSTIELIDLHTGSRRTLTGHERAVRAFAFSPDGRTLASGGLDGTLRLWRIDVGETLGVLERRRNGVIDQIGFSPDGTRLAAGGHEGNDSALSLWQIGPHDGVQRGAADGDHPPLRD